MPITYHILNGDALTPTFVDAKIQGEVIVTREAFIDGDLSGHNLDALWHSRAKHMKITYADYHGKVAEEFEKIIHASNGAEFNLWFEYDLFCQVNLWFVISLISGLPIDKRVYVVYPTYLPGTDPHFWNGYGRAESTDLNSCYSNRILLNDHDLSFGAQLWEAYKNNDFENLSALSKKQSLSFPYIEEVIQAHIDRFPKDGEFGGPERVIEEIVKTISTDFNSICAAFWKRESIYGFGDTQIRNLYDRVMRNRSHN